MNYKLQGVDDNEYVFGGEKNLDWVRLYNSVYFPLNITLFNIT